VKLLTQARNVLLFSLLLDDVKSGTTADLWSIFYDLYVDENTFQLVVRQSAKLVQSSDSLSMWTDSLYGNCLRMANAETLRLLNQYWKNYSNSHTSSKAFSEDFKFMVSETFGDHARSLKNETDKTSINEYGQHTEFFWKYVALSHETTTRTRCNPLFAYSSKGGNYLVVHPNTLPLRGFHSSISVTKLAVNSPYHHPDTECGTLNSAVASAKLQFRLWCNSFRLSTTNNALRLRFCVADAVNFCIKLNELNSNLGKAANCYSRPWSTQPLILEGDYDGANSAPHCFDVIDTSFLFDHVGPLNLFPYIVKLIRSPASVIYACVSMPDIDEEMHLLTTMLSSVDLGPNFTGLGIAPTDYVCGLSTHANHYGNPASDHSYRLTWRPTTSMDTGSIADTKLLANPCWNANAFCGFLLDMFPEEYQPDGIPFMQPTRYTPCTYAAFVAFHKQQDHVNWEELMTCLIDEIESRECTSRMREELFMYFRLFGLLPPSTEQIVNTISPSSRPSGVLRRDNLPETVALIVTVTREQLNYLRTIPKFGEADITRFNLVWNGISSEHTFSTIQPIFGGLRTDAGKAIIEEDPDGWNGTSDLNLCTYIPSTFLLNMTRESGALAVALYLYPIATREVPVKTCIDNANVHVFDSLPGLDPPASRTSHGSDERIAVRTAAFSITYPQLVRYGTVLTIVINMVKGKRNYQTLAQKPKPRITVTQKSFCTLTVKYADIEHDCSFPFPVIGSATQIRVSYENDKWIRITAPLVSPLNRHDQTYFFPLFRRADNIISTWNLPYLYFGALAELDPLADDLETWLVPHLLSVYSDRELSLRQMTPDLLTHIKNCIHAMMLPENTIVRLKSNDRSLTFLLARLYLDLNCHSVVREAYVLETSSDQMFNNSAVVQLTISEPQMKLWRSALPAMVERCRHWEHLQTCEYISDSRFTSLCSCGKGNVPEEFSTFEGWNLKPHATRIAISPIFCPPYLERTRGFSKCLAENNAECMEILRTFTPITDATDMSSQKQKCKMCWKDSSRKCSKCEEVVYCSTTCQGKDWKEHKVFCAARKKYEKSKYPRLLEEIFDDLRICDLSLENTGPEFLF
jgi:hypothetical protein